MPRRTSRLSCSSFQKKKLAAPRSKPSLPKAKFRHRQLTRHSSPAGRSRPILRMKRNQLRQNPVMGRSRPILRMEGKQLHQNPVMGRSRPILRMEGEQLHQNPVMGRKQPTLRTERMKPFRQNPAMERKQPTLRMRKKQTCLMMKPTLPSGRGELCPRMSRSRFSRL